MKLELSVFAILVFVFLASCTSVQRQAPVNSLEKQLLGKRPISLQWISWENFGEAVVKPADEGLAITGEQRGKNGSDYLQIEGLITNVTASGFDFDGVIETRISHNNGGQAYRREGKLTFRLYGNRRFWRLVEMDSPDGTVDYVDIYFDMESATAEPDY